MREKMKGILQKRSYAFIFGLLFFITYALFMNDSITSDYVASYANSEGGHLSDFWHHFKSGRFMNFFIELFYKIMLELNVSHVSNRWILQLILIIICAAVSERLLKLFVQYVPEKRIILVSLLALNFMNPYFVESFVYAGAELGVGILLIELAVEKFAKHKYLLSCFLVFCGISVYQSYIALFVIWGVACIFVSSRDDSAWCIIKKYLKVMHELDGLIMTMPADDPKWSFIRYDESGKVLEVREKEVISDQATVGIYNYKRGKDFVSSAKRMIRENLRVNNEFYVAPAYNLMIEEGANIGYFDVGNKMYGLGVPADLEFFLERAFVKEIFA